METDQPKTKDVSDLLLGVATIAGAIQGIAGRMAIAATVFRFVKDDRNVGDDLSARFRNNLLDSLVKLEDVLNGMADRMNECDGVTEADELATRSAFNMAEYLLRGDDDLLSEYEEDAE